MGEMIATSAEKKKRLSGRGTRENPQNRFDQIDYVAEPEADEEEQPLKTAFYNDAARSVIAYNKSPDIPFNASINPYRGCEHGCIYCYARPSHEYLGLSSGLDFETKIFVKKDAATLLRKELLSPRWKPQSIAVSGNTDPYQPAERHFEITRECLKVLRDFRNPAGVITKNHLITRDIDIFQEMAEHRCIAAMISITTLDPKLARIMEPRTSQPQRRLEAVKKLADAGIPVGVMVAPIIPGLNDHEIPRIVEAAADAGAHSAANVMLRLPLSLGPLFENWLEDHFPDRKEKVLNRLKSMRDGKLYSPEFHKRMRGEGIFADQISTMFKIACRKANFPEGRPRLTAENFRRHGAEQLSLF